MVIAPNHQTFGDPILVTIAVRRPIHYMAWNRLFRVPVLGWLIRRRFWGNGYATEAARALKPLVPGRFVSMIRVENEASANVSRKLGMTVEREVAYQGFRTQVWTTQTSASRASVSPFFSDPAEYCG